MAFLSAQLYNSTLLLVSMLLLQNCTNTAPAGNQPQGPDVLHLWSGAPSSDGITIGIQWRGKAHFELRLSTDSLFYDSARTLKNNRADIPPYCVKRKVENLKSDQKYYYAAFREGLRVGPLGSFHTFAAGPQSFQIALASCQRTGSEASIFRAMAAMDPLFFLQLGDYHYENISADCDSSFLSAFQANWYSASQNTLLRKAPFVYMWDDHDYGPNNSDATAPCRENAVEAYRRYIPHYELPFTGNMDPVSQSFVVGRVRFVLSDLRSQKLKPSYAVCQRLTEGSNFGGEAHIAWFFEELLAAKTAGQVVAWVSGIPFISREGGPNYDCDEDDDWGGYPEERERIANFVKAHSIPIFILSGDAHMCAIDDGTNSDYAEGGGAPIPVFHAGPLHDSPSYKGGPYSHGYSAAPYQYGLMKVEDDGSGAVCVTWKAYNDENRVVRVRNTEKELWHRFCLTP